MASRRQLAALVLAGIVLFLLGFLIGYLAIPKDDSDTSPTIEDLRNDEIQKKMEYHSQLYKSLDKTEIGKNLKYVCVVS